MLAVENTAGVCGVGWNVCPKASLWPCVQVAGALLSSLPAARVLCSNWLAYQCASPSLQHAWQVLGPQQHALHSRSLWPVQFLRLQGQPFTSSSHSYSTEQQQKQQGSSKTHDQGSGSSSKSQHGSGVQQEAQEAAKGLLSKSLDMEELWFAAVGGKLKVWSAKTYPDLKVGPQTLFACQQQQGGQLNCRAAIISAFLSSCVQCHIIALNRPACVLPHSYVHQAPQNSLHLSNK